jgi:hypothetical protein
MQALNSRLATAKAEDDSSHSLTIYAEHHQGTAAVRFHPSLHESFHHRAPYIAAICRRKRLVC